MHLCGFVKLDRRQCTFDFFPVGLKPTREFEALTETFRGLVDCKTRRIGSQLKQHTTGLTEIHRVEVATVDDRCYVEMFFASRW